MAKKKKTDDAVAPAPVAPVERPGEEIVLESDGGSQILHVGGRNARDAHQLIAGVSWYHKSEDEKGRWVYRQN